MKKYTVDEWGSDPDLDNDDHWCSHDFDTLAAAEAFFNDTFEPGCAVIVLCEEEIGSNEITILAKRKNPAFVKCANDDSDWRHEQAMQAGMMGGCDAYNEAMGYDCEPYESYNE